ncbi:MAG TPA: FHA domain-containing protein [Puia sp.]|jgi:hypothetical protein|nr:FHA domain-containing protein [Puia sp.]
MTRKEALEFLELPEFAGDLDIKTRLAEKLAYFELLSEKSPSAFLRRIHGQNVAKVILLQKESLQWSAPVAEPLFPEMPKQAEIIAQEKSFGDQELLSQDKLSVGLEYSQEPGLRSKQDGPEPMAILQTGSFDKPTEILKGPELEPQPEIVRDGETIHKTDFDSPSQNLQDQEISGPPEIVRDPEPLQQAETPEEVQNLPVREVVEQPEIPIAPEVNYPMESKEPIQIVDEKPIVSAPEIIEDELTPQETIVEAEPQILAEQEAPAMQEIIQPIESKEEPEPPSKPVIPQELEIPAKPEPLQKADTTTFLPTVKWNPPAQKPKPLPEAVGWLIRHTENQSVKRFPVYPGKNFLGRTPQPGLKPFIQIEEDPFVSRVHAALYVEEAAPYVFYISDTASSNGGKASKNGTYVNGSEDRINTKVKLNDRDTVQIGVTKFVLRFKNANLKRMIEEVEGSDYMHTVAIDVRNL